MKVLRNNPSNGMDTFIILHLANIFMWSRNTENKTVTSLNPAMFTIYRLGQISSTFKCIEFHWH